MKKFTVAFIILFVVLFTIFILGCASIVRYKLEISYNITVQKNMPWDFDSALYFKAETFEFHKKERILVLSGIRNFYEESGSNPVVADYVEVEDNMIILHLSREFSYRITINGKKYRLESLNGR